MRQPIRKTLRRVAAVVVVGAGLAALDGDTAVRICGGYVCGEVQKEEFISQGGTVRCVARGAGADRKDFVRARPIEREFSLEHLLIRAALPPWRIVEAVVYSQTQLPTPKLGTWQKASERAECCRSTWETIKTCISRTISLARRWRSDARSQYVSWSRARL